jgi:hypothetical protein
VTPFLSLLYFCATFLSSGFLGSFESYFVLTTLFRYFVRSKDFELCHLKLAVVVVVVVEGALAVMVEEEAEGVEEDHKVEVNQGLFRKLNLDVVGAKVMVPGR